VRTGRTRAVGEGIGNKGVGFRSALQTCAAPEVYSTLPGGAPGFCFRFARPDDVTELVGGDPDLARQVVDEVSLYSITLPAETTPDRVASLWAEGVLTG
jgi:ABC-type amino acid transport substrate-binding protein